MLVHNAPEVSGRAGLAGVGYVGWAGGRALAVTGRVGGQIPRQIRRRGVRIIWLSPVEEIKGGSPELDPAVFVFAELKALEQRHVEVV